MADPQAISRARAHKTTMQVLSQTSESPELRQSAMAILDCMEWLDSNFDDLQAIFESLRQQSAALQEISQRINKIDGKGVDYQTTP